MLRKLLLALLLLTLLGAGGWYGWRWYTTPVPPDISLQGISEELATAIDKARQAVRRQPRSSAAWGKLALVLGANGFEPQAIKCLIQAERFDPSHPRWPYLRG